METITHFGSIVLLIPFSLLLAAWLASRAGAYNALLWCACVGAVGGFTALAKVWFEACGRHILNVHSPSGHTGFASIAYGGFTVIAMAGSHSLRANLFRIATVIWVLLIGVSRVVVHAHTPGEVVVGWIIGGCAVAVFATFYRGQVRPPYLLAGGIIVVVTLIGLLLPPELPTLEPWLRNIAQLLYPYRDLICG